MDNPGFVFVRTRLHALISVLLVFIFIQALDAVIRLGVFGAMIPAPPGYLCVVILVGLSRTITDAMLRDKRVSGALPRARELLLTLLAALFLLWVLSGRPFRGDFIPWRPDVAWPLVLCATQWVLTLTAQNAFRARELFLSLMGGRTGHELVKAAREASGEAGEAQQAMTRLKRLAVVFDVFVLLPYLIVVVVRAAGGNGSVAVGVTIRVVAQAVGSVAFIVIANGFLDQQLACAAGVPPDSRRSSDRFGVPLAGVAALFLLSLVIAGARAVLPIAWMAELLNWLSRRPGVGGSFTPRPPAAPDIGSQTAPMTLPPLPSVTPSPILEAFWHILAILVVAVAALGIVFFVVRPLLSRSTRRAARQLHPLRSLKKRAILALRVLANLPRRIAALLRASGKGLRSLPDAIREAVRESVGERRANAGRSELRLKATGRAVREFRRIARWGARDGVHFTAREGPMEYARRLAERAPEKASALREAALLVEELVYGNSLSESDERALARIVNGIVR